MHLRGTPCRLGIFLAVLAVPWCAADTKNAGPRPTDVVRQRFDAAQRAQAEGDMPRAESEYRQLLGVSLQELGSAYLSLSDLKNAEDAYRAATQASADSESALIGLAVVYLRNGNFQAGVDVVRTLLAQKPMHAGARQLLGKLYFGMGRYDAAVSELSEARRLDPEDTDTALTLALTYLKQQQLDKARKIFAETLPRLGDTVRTHILFGAAYRDSEYPAEAVAEFRRALELDPDYPRLHYYLGIALLSEEHPATVAEAIQQFQEELRRHPNHYLSEYLLGLIFLQQRKLDDAVHYLQQAMKLEPGKPDAPLYLGQALYLQGHTDQAVPLLQRAIDLTPDPSRNQYQISRAHYLLSQYFARQGNTAEAEKHATLASAYKSKASVADQERLRNYLRGGTTGDDDSENRADKSKSVIIAPEPPSPDERKRLESSVKFYSEVAGNAYNQLGLMRAREGDFRRAAQFLAGADRWDPALPDVAFNLGLARFKAQDYPGAIAALEKAPPGRPEIPVLLGLSYFFNEDYKHALERLEPLGQTQDPQIAYALGLSLVYAGDRARGIDVLKGLMERYPQAADTHIAMGRAYAVSEDYDRAAAEFSKALELDATAPDAHYYLGLALLHRQKFADAAAEFRREIERNPRHARAQYHLGFTLAVMEQYDDAIQHFREAIRLDPAYGDAYYELGKAQLKKADVAEAVGNLEKAAKLEGNKSYIQYQLSQAYLKAGRADDAQVALARYRDLKSRERPAAK